MNYNKKVPDFLSYNAMKTVNKRFDITEDQFNTLAEIYTNLKIPPSAIVRLALNCFLPKINNDNFRYEGINRLWNDTKF